MGQQFTDQFADRPGPAGGPSLRLFPIDFLTYMMMALAEAQGLNVDALYEEWHGTHGPGADDAEAQDTRHAPLDDSLSLSSVEPNHSTLDSGSAFVMSSTLPRATGPSENDAFFLMFSDGPSENESGPVVPPANLALVIPGPVDRRAKAPVGPKFKLTPPTSTRATRSGATPVRKRSGPPIPPWAIEKMLAGCYLADTPEKRRLVFRRDVEHVVVVLGQLLDAHADLNRLGEFFSWWAKQEWTNGGAPNPQTVARFWLRAMAELDAQVLEGLPLFTQPEPEEYENINAAILEQGRQRAGEVGQ